MEQKADNNRIKDIIVNNRVLLIITGLLLVGIIIMIIFNNRSDNDAYILLDANHIVGVTENSFKMIDRNGTDLEYLNQKYRVFYGGTFLGTYDLDNETKLTPDDDTLYFTDGKKSFSFEKPNLAVSRNVDYIDYTFIDMSEDDFIVMRDSLAISWISSLSDLVYAKKVVLDFNADGKDESLYFVTYIGKSNEPKDSEPPFSIVYISVDDEIVLLEESTLNSSEQILYDFELSYIIDVFKDGNVEIIISYTDYDISSYKVYQVNGKNCDLVLEISSGVL